MLLGGWFTYDVSGSADAANAQHWYLLQGDLVDATGGVTTATINRASGGRFDHRPTANVQAVGSAEISFTGCGSAQMSYRFDDNELAGSFAGLRGALSLRRLLPCGQ